MFRDDARNRTEIGCAIRNGWLHRNPAPDSRRVWMGHAFPCGRDGRLMCGRFLASKSPDEIARWFATRNATPNVRQRYNIAPTQDILFVRFNPETKERTLDALRWGLVPFWAKDIKIGYSLINAKAETVAEKPAFREAFKSRRCLIAADGFYEWKKLDAKTKQP